MICYRSLVVALVLLTSPALSSNVLPRPLPRYHAPLSPTKVSRADTNSSTVENQQLVSGLGLGIMAQQGQMAVASMIQSLNQASPAPSPNSTYFQAAKDDLLAFLDAGMRARANSIKISSNVQVTRGLIKIEEAQILQLGMINNLTGDPAQDAASLNTLQQQFAAGIQENMQLQALANGSTATGPVK